ncbi:MAG TPA: adenylate/guanylate cyclase domain-containing protein [Candidatus Didemnitutus sp.]|nr:adenylate/guanylate cyclase domain-containing protein [Candidatus Didemnitutus sp.]
MRAWFRFRRFRTRLLVMLLGLLAAVLGITYVLVSRANYASALTHSEANLDLGARVYEEAVRQRIALLTKGAESMTRDYAMKQVLLENNPDAGTLSSSLHTFSERIDAPVIALFDTQGNLLANSKATLDDENRGPFAYLIRLATERDAETESGYAYLEEKLQVLVVVPLYAPPPVITNWFGLAFPIDQHFADAIKGTTRLDLTFVQTDVPGGGGARVLASTLASDQAREVAEAVVANMKTPQRIKVVPVGGQPYLTQFKAEPMLGDSPLTVVLQRPLGPELEAAHELENYLILISLAALAVALLVALGLARNVSQPLQALTDHTRLVTAGDYGIRISLERSDELGELAGAFNQMTAGLAERDRVRDLLGKVVSSKIATQLLKSDVKLGGEEREVTVLFSDLRNFTGWSESLAPTDVLAQLNRYLDRMSRIVEKNDGVIDKFIGDAIMALFGAPLSDADDADRAIATAREMDAALDELNRELIAEGKAPFAFGIGINTARVVAGNMGSKTRLNYTVIGDGVNLASRLEGLTKDPAYQTRIIISEATLRAAKRPPEVRALGEVHVKGKAEAIKIFAVAAKGESRPPV